MDVRCARCGIEYEFDDALISERGTMVRCTECGHQFRVHPSHVIPGAPDEWRVITQDGQSIVYVTLRELQQGITQGQVGRDATLIRGGGPPRPLGTIAELDPFFPTPAVETKQQSTLTGVAPPSLAPAEPKPARPSGRTPIARIGLNTVQVSASGVALEASQALARPRKTTLGIGAQVPKQAQVPGASDAHAGEYGTEITASFEEPAAAQNSRSSTSALRPAFRSPKIAEAAALAKAVTAKSTARKPDTSEPPTARMAEAAQKEAQANAVVPRRAMSPAGGATAASDVNAEAPAVVAHEAPHTLSAGEPLEPAPPLAEGPSATDPPPAQRHVRDESQFLADDDQTVPIGNSPNPIPKSEPAAASAGSGEPRDESLPLVFEAESPPLELPGDRASQAPAAAPAAVKAQAVEPEAGTFMPTVPPRRLLTQLDSVEPETVRKRSSRVGVGLMLALLGVLIALGTLWWRSRAAAPIAAVPQTAPSLEDYLGRAGDALRAGDLVRAHDQLQASQSAGGRDPRWMALTARYDVMRADMNWLAVHLADPNDAPHLEALKRELVENTAQASRALKAIEPLGLNATELAAARLDAARLRGELEQAMKDAEALRKSAMAPDLAYSLASLEFASEHPNTKSMFEWLGVARAADSGLGRAPALLVLACVASDRLDSARAELQRLKLAAHSHPLLPEIEWFVNRGATPRAAAAESAAPTASTPSPVGADAPALQATASESLADITKEGDFRLRLRRGVEALSHGELTRAELFFRSVIAERPSDTEALTGLGDVARRRNNTTSAMSYYQKVLASNGQYLPALSALGDLKWKSGDRAGAAVHYRRILEQVSESSSYGQTAAQRLREMNEGAAKPSAEGASATGAGKSESAGKAK